MVGGGAGWYSSSHRSSSNSHHLSSNSHSNNNRSSSNSSVRNYSSSSRESHAPCNIHIEKRFDENAIQSWIRARNVFGSVAGRKRLSLRAKQHLAYADWKIRQSTNGKFCYTPPNNNNQVFRNLLDACLYQLFNIDGGGGGDAGGGGGDVDVDDVMDNNDNAVVDNEVDNNDDLDDDDDDEMDDVDVDDDDEIYDTDDEIEEEEEEFDSLDQMLFKKIKIGDQLIWTLIQRSNDIQHIALLLSVQKMLQTCFHKKLSDMVNGTVFGTERYEGFYTCLLRKEGRVVCAATFRPHASLRGFAVEMPFVGTHIRFRGQKLCKIMLARLDTYLTQFGVSDVLLPSARGELFDMWTRNFGFAKITSPDEFVQIFGNRLVDIVNFEDIIWCRKILKQ